MRPSESMMQTTYSRTLYILETDTEVSKKPARTLRFPKNTARTLRVPKRTAMTLRVSRNLARILRVLKIPAALGELLLFLPPAACRAFVVC